MSDAASIVGEFCGLMVKRDAEDAEALPGRWRHLSEHRDASHGRHRRHRPELGRSVRRVPDSYEYRVQNLAADGDVVMTERLDMIKGPDGTLHGVPVMGTFVVRNGKITRWTDYWDTALPAKMMAGEDVSALVPQTY